MNLFSEINTMMRQPYKNDVLLLNTFFIIILLLALIIIYYNNIKTSASINPSCIINHKRDKTNVIAKNKSGNSIFEITYDEDKKTANSKCLCPIGKNVNKIKDVPIINLEDNTINNKDITCYCDNIYYDVNDKTLNEIIYTGNPYYVKRTYDNKK